MFIGMGLEGLAQRAERELLAAGERPANVPPKPATTSLPRRPTSCGSSATASPIPKIEARLFIGPRTAEYHLHKVFNKLGIISRNEPAVGGERGRCRRVRGWCDWRSGGGRGR